MLSSRKTWVAGLVAVSLSGGAVWAQNVTADTVVATVGDAEITVGHMIVARGTLPQQYAQLPNETLFPAILDQLIQQNALAQSLEGVTKATELQIENQISGLLAGEALGKVAQSAASDDEAIQEAYTAQFGGVDPEMEFNASHILVATQEEAAEIKAALDEGADFAATAREKSTGPSGPNGGSLGWFTKGMMVPEFETVAIQLQPGEVSAPVQTQFGWHVILLNDSRLRDAPPLEEVRDQLAQEVQQGAVAAHIRTVVDEAVVTRADVQIDPSILSNLDLVAE